MTVDGEPRPLPDPFLVVATQNPIEYEGTYPLPEAQLDRFLLKVDVGYPDEAEERAILRLAAPRASRRRRSTTSSRSSTPGELARPRARSTATRRRRRGARLRPGARAARRASCRASSSAPARARRCTCSPRRRRSARLDGRAFVTPDDVARPPPAGAPPPAHPAPGGRARALPARRRGGVGAAHRSRPAVTPTAARGAGGRRRGAVGRWSCRGSSRWSWHSRCSSRRWSTASALARPPDVEREAPADGRRAASRHDCGSRRPDGLPATVRQPQSADLRVEPRQAVGALEAQIVARRRGRHPLPAAAIRVDGPLGLGRWTTARRRGGRAPRVSRPAGGAPARARDPSAAASGAPACAAGPLGLGTEFEAVREYHADDDVRQINWRATERMGRPMSNQFRVERERDVVCLVDCGRLTAAPVGDRTRLDVAARRLRRGGSDCRRARRPVGRDRLRRRRPRSSAAAPERARPRSSCALRPRAARRSTATTSRAFALVGGRSGRSCSCSPTSSRRPQPGRCSRRCPCLHDGTR